MIILVTRSQKYKIDDLRMYCQINALIAISDSVITVGSGKDFASIQEAVDYAQDGWTIVVYPGEYEEAVDAHEKTIRIIGMDKATCILKYPNSDYGTPPLEMGAGELINMTIYAMENEMHFIAMMIQQKRNRRIKS